jgi:hypothetical protein
MKGKGSIVCWGFTLGTYDLKIALSQMMPHRKEK